MIIEIIKLIAWALDDSKNKSVLENLRRQNEEVQAAQRRAQQAEYQQRQSGRQSQPGSKRSRKPMAAAPPMPAVARAAESALASAPQRAPTANAAAIARWAQPKTLRSQFVLTEILKPPLSMRDVNERAG